MPIETSFQTRRGFIAVAVAVAVACATRPSARARADDLRPESRWYDAAADMRRLALSWGDQPYGAVVVLGGSLVGEGPSRVVRNRDPDAHAEREAIRDAQRRLGRQDLRGAMLYSTSRPCSVCEAAAARAGIARMYHGSTLTDGGAPGERR